MQERVEFRIPEKNATRFLRPNEGVMVGSSVRKYELNTNDPRFSELGRFDQQMKAGGRAFFTAWRVHRRYSFEELQKAELFRAKIISVFEPAGEECNTKYDESTACPSCKAGAKQVTDLFLNWKRISRRKDISKTIAGEIVASRRLVDLFGEHGIVGANFRPIRHNPASSAQSKDWFQLVVDYCEVDVTAPTKTGADPFDEDLAGKYRCPRRDLIGLNLLSGVWAASASHNGWDIVASKQFIGSRRGLLRPERVLFISPKLWRLIGQKKLKGFELEVAHLK